MGNHCEGEESSKNRGSQNQFHQSAAWGKNSHPKENQDEKRTTTTSKTIKERGRVREASLSKSARVG